MTIDKSLLQECLSYIDNYWNEVTYQPKDTHNNPQIIPLPRPFMSVNSKKSSHWKGVMFYWDSFFILRGIVDTKREWIIPGMVDNFIYLLRQYGVIPNANFWGFLLNSQPPFLSSVTFDAYYAIKRGGGIKAKLKAPYANLWLRTRLKYVHQEYWQVWQDEGRNGYNHYVEEYNLNKYGDRDVGYPVNAERESGWDFTSRFYSRCQEFLPIDLNSYLHKYEKDFAKAAHIFHNKKNEAFWEQRAADRHNRIKKYMWNEKEGFFFDYDFVNKCQSAFYSLAGFVPMWAKLATPQEAERMVKKLPFFETDYGLTITDKKSLPKEPSLTVIPEPLRPTVRALFAPKQWDYPHIWAPLEYLTVMGLLRYGYVDDAVRIMKKSINANITIFKKYGALLEKIDAITGEKAKSFWYPSQLGFGWTNAIFYRYTKMLEYIDQQDGKIYSTESLAQGAPYSLTSIMH